MKRRLFRLIVFAASLMLMASAAQARAPDRGYEVLRQTDTDITVRVGKGFSIEQLVKDFGPMYRKTTGKTLTWRQIAEANSGNVIPACRLPNGSFSYHANRSTNAWDTCPEHMQTAILLADGYTKIPLEALMTSQEELANLSSTNAQMRSTMDAMNTCLAHPTADCLTQLIQQAKGTVPPGLLHPDPPEKIVTVKVPTVPRWAFGSILVGIVSSVCCLALAMGLYLTLTRWRDLTQEVATIVVRNHPVLGLKPLVALKEWASIVESNAVHVAEMQVKLAKLEEELTQARAEKTQARTQSAMMFGSIVKLAKEQGYQPGPEAISDPNTLVTSAFAFLGSLRDRLLSEFAETQLREQSRMAQREKDLNDREVYCGKLEELFRRHLGGFCKAFEMEDLSTIEAVDRLKGVSGVFRMAETQLIELRKRADENEHALETMTELRDQLQEQVRRLREQIDQFSSANTLRPQAFQPHHWQQFWAKPEKTDMRPVIHADLMTTFWTCLRRVIAERGLLVVSEPEEFNLLRRLNEKGVLISNHLLNLDGELGKKFKIATNNPNLTSVFDMAHVSSFTFLHAAVFG